MKSIVLPVVLVIALTGAVSSQTKVRQSATGASPSALQEQDSGFVSIEGTLRLIEGMLAVESDGVTYIVRLPDFPGSAGEDFSEGDRIRLEGCRSDSGDSPDKIVLKPARLRRLDG